MVHTYTSRSSQNSGTKKASGAKLICNNRQNNVLGHYEYLHVAHTNKKDYQQVHTVYYLYRIGNW